MIALIIALSFGNGWAMADPVPKDSAKADPKLVGRWTMIRTFSGKDETTEDPPRAEYEFKADGAWIMRRDGKDYAGGPGKFSTDLTADPARIDLIRDPDNPKNRLVTEGIYRIEGDTLTVQMPARGEGRPASFEGPRAGYLVILKRVKKDGAADPSAREAPKPDRRLVGRWQVVRTFSGLTETTKDNPGGEYEFMADGELVFRREGKKAEIAPGKVTTNPKATPAQIDLVIELTSEDRLTIQGIYKIEGDTLTLRSAERGQSRPESFEGPGKHVRVVLKRVK